jgi:hypothetical protein
MSYAYIIEIDEEAVGLVVQQNGDDARERGYRFYASTPSLREIEGKAFGSPAKARKAATALWRKRGRTREAA